MNRVQASQKFEFTPIILVSMPMIIGMAGFIMHVLAYKNIEYNLRGCNYAIYLDRYKCCPSNYSMKLVCIAMFISIPCLCFLYLNAKSEKSGKKQFLISLAGLLLSIVVAALTYNGFSYCLKVFENVNPLGSYSIILLTSYSLKLISYFLLSIYLDLLDHILHITKD